MTTVAVLGTGLMGTPMARRLARSGFGVRVWNRTIDKAKPLADDGAVVCSSAREACEGAEVVLTMLLSADAVIDSMAGDDGGLAGLPDDAVWLQCSTVGLDGTDRLVELAAERGVSYLDAPVLGTVTPAEKGELVILASGDETLRDRVSGVLDCIGSRTMWVGDVGAGSRLKLVCNSWVLSVVAGVADAMALADGFELDPSLFLDAIKGGALDLPYAHLKGKLIIDREFPAAFPVSGMAKDAGLILDAAASVGVSLAVAPGARAAMTKAADDGHADEDMAAVFYAIRGS